MLDPRVTPQIFSQEFIGEYLLNLKQSIDFIERNDLL